MSRSRALVAIAGLAACSQALAVVFNEVEPNDNKATATNVFGIVAGDTIVGNSTASTGVGLDYFLVRTAATPLGIYRNRLTITSAQAHTGTLRGLNQSAGVIGTTDTTIQTSTTIGGVPRVNQWYSFGRASDIYYRVTGTSTTTTDYTVSYAQDLITPTHIGSFNPGSITITTRAQGHTTDTDFWVYDGNLNAIAGYGNDDESIAQGGTGATLQSLLVRNYAAGTYYIAMTNFNFANNQASPPDDDFLSGAVLDFADVAANSSSTINANLTFTITDGASSIQVANTKVGQFDINWFSFTVIPAPGAAALFGLAGLAGLRRRR